MMNIAVYIDADNISWKYASHVRGIAQNIGVIKKAIAIGEKQRFQGKKGWHTTCWVSPCPISTIGKKRNATDFEMTMRMGEDVATRKFDAFCIVADDNDYITAAERLRARGVQVFGIGLGKAPDTYKKVLKKYFDLKEESQTGTKDVSYLRSPKSNGVLDGYCDQCLSGACKMGCILQEYGTKYCQWALAACGYYYRHAGCSYIADGYWKRVVRMICGTDELMDAQRDQIEKWVLGQDVNGVLYRDFIEFARESTRRQEMKNRERPSGRRR